MSCAWWDFFDDLQDPDALILGGVDDVEPHLRCLLQRTCKGLQGLGLPCLDLLRRVVVDRIKL